MRLFKKKKFKTSPHTESKHFEQIYQYSSGEFLPNSSQPDPNKNYKISTGMYTPHQSTRYLNITIGNNGLPQKNGKECEKALPELYKVREDCCGCTACYAICPANAIFMNPDEEGFLYPVVDASKCVRCYKCNEICPVKMNNVKNSI